MVYGRSGCRDGRGRGPSGGGGGGGPLPIDERAEAGNESRLKMSDKGGRVLVPSSSMENHRSVDVLGEARSNTFSEADAAISDSDGQRSRPRFRVGIPPRGVGWGGQASIFHVNTLKYTRTVIGLEGGKGLHSIRATGSTAQPSPASYPCTGLSYTQIAQKKLP